MATNPYANGNGQQMEKDWTDAWATNKPGSSVAWGKGKIDFIDGSTAAYTNSAGEQTKFSKYDSFDDVAKSNSDIAEKWGADYGFKPTQKTVAPKLNFNLSSLQGATGWSVDPKTQTVGGQLETVLAKDSPLMARARTRALQSANADGRLNSTMAQTAGDAAMYDTALDIATPDARTYGDAARFSADASNQFARDANQFSQATAMANFNVEANEWAAKQDFGRTTQRDSTQAAYTRERDREQNAFNTSRDDKQNQFTTDRDIRQNQFTTDTNAKQNKFTTDRDTTLNQNTIDRDAKLNTFDRETKDADEKREEKRLATSRLYGARADFTTEVNRIITSKELGPEARREAISSLMTNYNLIIKKSAEQLGWNDPDSWLIKGSDVPADAEGEGGGDEGPDFIPGAGPAAPGYDVSGRPRRER